MAPSDEAQRLRAPITIHLLAQCAEYAEAPVTGWPECTASAGGRGQDGGNPVGAKLDGQLRARWFELHLAGRRQCVPPAHWWRSLTC